MSKKISEEIIDRAVHLHYQEKKSLSEISKIININRTSLSKRMKKRGLRILCHKCKDYGENVLEIVKNLHFDKKWSLTKIKNYLNLDRDTLRKKLKEAGIKYRNYQNELKVRTDLFSKIETEEDAYWLGFILADGYISDDGDFELSLNYNDYFHLIKFAKYCEFPLEKVVKKQPVGKKYYRCRIAFATQHLQENFNKVGIIARKSLILQFPPVSILNNNLVRHFLRGYVEGDGSFNLYYRKNKTIKYLSILGTNQFLEQIIQILNQNVELYLKTKKRLYQRYKDKNNYSLEYSGKSCENILHWLYKDATIFLDRKYEIYKNKFAV